VITRTEGVTASFLKELLRRAALFAAEATPATDGNGDGNGDRPGAPLRVTDAHMGAALYQLLDVRGQLTSRLLGSNGGQDAVIRPMGADALLRGVRRR
jgi:hypothetical protein